MFVEDMPFGTLHHIYLAGLVSATAAVGGSRLERMSYSRDPLSPIHPLLCLKVLSKAPRSFQAGDCRSIKDPEGTP